MGVAKSQFTHDGLCDWKHAHDRLGAHEQSKDHTQAVLSAASRATKAGRVDSELVQEVDRIEQYWRSALNRLVSVLKFACERGLALRGDNETFGSPNNENYLGIHCKNWMVKMTKKKGYNHFKMVNSTICLGCNQN